MEAALRRVNEFTRSAQICPRDNKTAFRNRPPATVPPVAFCLIFCPLDRSDAERVNSFTCLTLGPPPRPTTNATPNAQRRAQRPPPRPPTPADGRVSGRVPQRQPERGPQLYNYASGPANFVDTAPLPKITLDKLLLGAGVIGAAAIRLSSSEGHQ